MQWQSLVGLRIRRLTDDGDGFAHAKDEVQQRDIVDGLDHDETDAPTNVNEYLKGEAEEGEEKEQEAASLQPLVVPQNAQVASEYSEPSPWMVPTRHSLGALLLEQGRLAEAEEVYRQDLKKHPGNVWSLHGLAETLERLGKSEEAAEVRAEYEVARSKASVDVRASCYCRKVEA